MPKNPTHPWPAVTLCALKLYNFYKAWKRNTYIWHTSHSQTPPHPLLLPAVSNLSILQPLLIIRAFGIISATIPQNGLIHLCSCARYGGAPSRGAQLKFRMGLNSAHAALQNGFCIPFPRSPRANDNTTAAKNDAYRLFFLMRGGICGRMEGMEGLHKFRQRETCCMVISKKGWRGFFFFFFPPSSWHRRRPSLLLVWNIYPNKRASVQPLSLPLFSFLCPSHRLPSFFPPPLFPLAPLLGRIHADEVTNATIITPAISPLSVFHLCNNPPTFFFFPTTTESASACCGV